MRRGRGSLPSGVGRGARGTAGHSPAGGIRLRTYTRADLVMDDAQADEVDSLAREPAGRGRAGIAPPHPVPQPVVAVAAELLQRVLPLLEGPAIPSPPVGRTAYSGQTCRAECRAPRV